MYLPFSIHHLPQIPSIPHSPSPPPLPSPPPPSTISSPHQLPSRAHPSGAQNQAAILRSEGIEVTNGSRTYLFPLPSHPQPH